MNSILTNDDMIELDVETSNVCNLHCPLCLSRIDQFKDQFKPNFIDIAKLEDLILKFKNIDQVTLAGDASEPTLHPQLFELLDFLKAKPNIRVELFTNGSTHDNEYWTLLNKHLGPNSIVIFTICGTTQELHEKYRVGSNLEQLLAHVAAFKLGNLNKNDCMQYIKFEYNKNDSQEEIAKLKSLFSRSYDCNSNPIYERLNPLKKRNDGICVEHNLAAKYEIASIRSKKLHEPINCYMMNRRYIRVDNKLRMYPCCFYRLYTMANEHDAKEFYENHYDYSSILAGNYDYCFECVKSMDDFFEKNDLRQSNMC